MRIPAAVVTEYVNGEPRELWSDTSIQVLVPAGEPDIPIVSGPVIVTVNGIDSNSNFLFNPLPVPPGSDAPLINAVSPESGPAGTAVTLTGVNFGYSRGVSVATIGGLQLQVITWTDSEIIAVIPQGATTNLIRVLIGGVPAESPYAFMVDAVPFLSAVIPNVLEVGQSMQVYGRDLGPDVGSVTLTPPAGASGQGSTTVSGGGITSWSDSMITIDRLPSLNSDAGVPLDVTVRTGGSAPQVSENSITVNVYSPVQVTIDVDYTAGVAVETTFEFSVGVGGGAGPYTVVIDYGNSVTEQASELVASATSFDYVYQTAGTYTALVRATDANGSRTSVTGNPINVVAIGEPVIRDISIIDLDPGGTPADFRPNDEVGEYFGHYLNTIYNFDESFIPILDAVDLGDMETFAKRQWPLYTLEGRPYAYRVKGGSLVQIVGFNLLADQEQGNHGHILQLNYNGDGLPFLIGVGSDEYASWEDTFIQFRVPDVDTTIGGDVGIVFDGVSGKDAIVSPVKLVAAPVLFGYVADPSPPAMNGRITINFNDGTPAQVDSYIGTKAYLFWTFPADLEAGGPWTFDRNGDGSSTDNYLLPGGVPVTILPGQSSLEFDLNTIYRDGNALYGARDPAPGDPGAVGVTPRAGNWKVYMWVGSKPSPFAESFANSGIISNELIILGVTAP